MAPRQNLQMILSEFCQNVYFQPPSNVQMKYPAIVYERDRSDTQFANNSPYAVRRNYSITLITRDPDDGIFEALAGLPLCAHQRYYVADNLNHDVFSIYF